MKTLISRMLAIFLVLTMCLSLAAAQAEEPTTLLLMIGSESDPYWQSVFDMIADFNAEYEGKIHIETEFAGAQSADLMEKMKVLNASKALPAIVSRLNEDVGFAQTLAANDRLLDIRPYFEADETWQEYALANNVVSSIEMSGGDALYFTPLTSSCYIGLFYNKEMLAAVGYDEFPSDSWEEFWVMCDKLVEAGYTPFAMDTMDSAWCSMLLCTSIVGETQEGMEWMTGLYPTDFNNDYMRKVMDTFKRIFDNYTTPDANGAPYAVAANNFLSEQAAMIANGPWMINSMMDPSYCAEDFQYKVGYAPFPGNVMIIENDLIGQSAISKDVSEAEQMAAVEWFKFQARPEQIRKECLTRGYTVYVVKRTLAGIQRFGSRLYCTAEDVESGAYLTELIGAALGIEEYWKAFGLTGYLREEKADEALLKAAYEQADDLELLSLFVSYFTQPFASEEEILLARQTALAVSRYIVEHYGVRALLEEDCIALKQEWLRALGVDRVFDDPL